MEHLPALGTAIRDIVQPTIKLYEPHLLKNADDIRSVRRSIFSYGPHERQQLDVYRPYEARISQHGRRPVLLFLYGGGLTMGHKTLPGVADELCHANVASFFALRYGYDVVIPDYRLVGTHDAKFPSGGEDVCLAVRWILEKTGTFGPEPVDLFIMGNSAGGVHLSTFLLHENYAATRRSILRYNPHVQLRGIVFLSVPFHFRLAHASRAEVNKAYYGDEVDAHSPLGLLRKRQAGGEIDFIKSGARTLVLNGDLDPEDEILIPRDDFIKQWHATGSKLARQSLAVDFMHGHNHISPWVSLGTAARKDVTVDFMHEYAQISPWASPGAATDPEEAWGHQVAAFCNNVRIFEPPEW
ncbi:hypothetical protein CBER1_07470 [Cercospora berteroae]|uniref:BD-FAE-like domain-containing protein n=1 Tax=Cercospora berteroae TaxID=357750 RepID=A0A2S6BTG2_9PEZI|nr:hypothetical protein CBER1_07470 [Cercospora berteroae]